jgi:hypothetical protein
MTITTRVINAVYDTTDISVRASVFNSAGNVTELYIAAFDPSIHIENSDIDELLTFMTSTTPNRFATNSDVVARYVQNETVVDGGNVVYYTSIVGSGTVVVTTPDLVYDICVVARGHDYDDTPINAVTFALIGETPTFVSGGISLTNRDDTILTDVSYVLNVNSDITVTATINDIHNVNANIYAVAFTEERTVSEVKAYIDQFITGLQIAKRTYTPAELSIPVTTTFVLDKVISSDNTVYDMTQVNKAYTYIVAYQGSSSYDIDSMLPTHAMERALLYSSGIATVSGTVPVNIVVAANDIASTVVGTAGVGCSVSMRFKRGTFTTGRMLALFDTLNFKGLSINGDKVICNFDGTYTNVPITPTTSEWYVVHVNIEPTQFTVYMDGVLIGNQTISTVTFPLTIKQIESYANAIASLDYMIGTNTILTVTEMTTMDTGGGDTFYANNTANIAFAYLFNGNNLDSKGVFPVYTGFSFTYDTESTLDTDVSVSNDPHVYVSYQTIDPVSNILEVEGTVFSGYANIDKYYVFGFDTATVNLSSITKTSVLEFFNGSILSEFSFNDDGYYGSNGGNVLYYSDSEPNIDQYEIHSVTGSIGLDYVFSNMNDASEQIQITQNTLVTTIILTIDTVSRYGFNNGQ